MHSIRSRLGPENVHSACVCTGGGRERVNNYGFVELAIARDYLAKMSSVASISNMKAAGYLRCQRRRQCAIEADPVLCSCSCTRPDGPSWALKAGVFLSSMVAVFSSVVSRSRRPAAYLTMADVPVTVVN